MRNRLADAFERGLRSEACIQASHAGCSHAIGYGGGFNPRRFRFESGTELCKCPCHASCPVTSARVVVDSQIWQESCSCPGAPALRAYEEQRARNPRPPYQPYAPRHGHKDQPLSSLPVLLLRGESW
jgi:hypothetical protein